MVPVGKRDGNFTKDREIHGESNVCSTAERYKWNKRFDVNRLVGYGKQCSLVWSGDERGWSCLEKVIRF